MYINQKFALCRYYGSDQNVFVDAEIYNDKFTMTIELTKEKNGKSETIILSFDEENTKKLFDLVKIKDFKERFCEVEGLKKFDKFCKDNQIKSKVKKSFE